MASSSLSERAGLRQESPEVYYASGPFVVVGPEHLVWMKARATENPRQRVRICTHPSSADGLHEMLITHARDCYVRPHLHLGKSESFAVLEGSATVILFDKAGTITAVHDMAAPGSEKPFYYRMPERVFHTLLITSDWLIFHETTAGPFDPKKTEFAPWAPDGGDEAETSRYMVDLAGRARASLPSEP